MYNAMPSKNITELLAEFSKQKFPENYYGVEAFIYRYGMGVKKI